MDAVANGAGDPVQVDLSPEHPNRLSVSGAVQQMVKRSLQISHRAADLGNKMPTGNGNDHLTSGTLYIYHLPGR